MKSSVRSLPQARTWREIPHQVRPRAMSRGGRRRLWLTLGRTIGAVLVLGLLGGAIFVFAGLFQDKPQHIAAAVNAVPMRAPVLRTDGVLDQPWLQRTLALPAKATLMDIDLLQLRERVLADPQVRTATLTRKFPDTMEVSIAERSPIALVNARIGQAAPRPLLVARDGVVYAGNGYDPRILQELPFLDGIKLVRSGDRFLPLQGMETVAELLATARNEAPHLYQSWRVVALGRLERDGEIEVRSDHVERIVFGARSRDDFMRQLAQLDLLIDTTRARTDRPIQEINLAVGRMTDGRIQVPVTFDAPLDPATVAPVPSPALSPAFFKPYRQSEREL